MKRLLIDTDVIIDALRGSLVAHHFIESNVDRVCLSVITVTEIYAGIRGEAERQAVERFFSAFLLLDVTPSIAQKAGHWISQFGRSHAVELPDALIAGTAAEHGLEMKTLNIKHFPMFKGLDPAYRKK
jgi:predicted nucleic acid-binding protein